MTIRLVSCSSSSAAGLRDGTVTWSAFGDELKQCLSMALCIP